MTWQARTAPGRSWLKRVSPNGIEIVLRRVVQSSGRSKAYLNGRLCTASQLAELAPELVDISSQHQSVALTDPATHLGYLDSFAKLEPSRGRLAVVVDDLMARTKQIHELEQLERSRGEREAFLRFQLAAIEEVNPREGEVAELESERARLRHADRLGRVTRDAAHALYDKDASICDELARLGGELASVRDLDPALEPFFAGVEAARNELVEAARGLGRYAEGIESDPGRLSEVDERLFALSKLMRQHGGDLSGVLAARSRLAGEIDALAGSQDRLVAERAALTAILSKAAEMANELSVGSQEGRGTIGRIDWQRARCARDGARPGGRRGRVAARRNRARSFRRQAGS